MDDQVRATGAIPVRLAGASRYDTAALVANEAARVRQAPQRVHLVHADAWADAVTVGGQAATHATSVLLVDRDRVPQPTRQFLQANPQAERIVVGGSSGISDAVVDAVHGRRLAGSDRAGTGIAVMEELWGRTQASPGDPFVVTPGWTGDGWATALAHTSWAAAQGAPLLFSAGTVPTVVRDALHHAGYALGASGVTRFARHVSPPVQEAFRAAIGG
ncbi:MAG TPA: cell wall-binding repeat-containing protein [Euzebya sp.]|nr:cell wall-binding repeat-containing protein [Euzebya sp.]